MRAVSGRFGKVLWIIVLYNTRPAASLIFGSPRNPILSHGLGCRIPSDPFGSPRIPPGSPRTISGSRYLLWPKVVAKGCRKLLFGRMRSILGPRAPHGSKRGCLLLGPARRMVVNFTHQPVNVWFRVLRVGGEISRNGILPHRGICWPNSPHSGPLLLYYFIIILL